MTPFLQRLWYFLWKDDSLLSWLVNVALAFVLVKYLIYPSLGLLLSTSFPVVAVVSGSMEHDVPFEAWWAANRDLYESLGISQEDFARYSFSNGFDKGDIMIIYGLSVESIKKGHVVVYRSSPGYPPIIHRVVDIAHEGDQRVFTTKGDHNPVFDKPAITQDRLLGTAVFRIPYLGWVKIWFTQLITLTL